MHRPIVFLVVALLCLRAWAGAAMAGEMAVQQLASPAAFVLTAMPDCPGHAAMQDQAGDPDADAAACTACGACTLHALPASQVMPSGALRHTTIPAEPVHFSSIASPPARKPPIA